MNTYIEKALLTYCDTSQTYIAREIAHATLTNAGFTEQDLRKALETGPDDISVMVFSA